LIIGHLTLLTYFSIFFSHFIRHFSHHSLAKATNQQEGHLRGAKKKEAILGKGIDNQESDLEPLEGQLHNQGQIYNLAFEHSVGQKIQ